MAQGYIDRSGRVWCPNCASVSPEATSRQYITLRDPEGPPSQIVCEGCGAVIAYGGQDLPTGG